MNCQNRGGTCQDRANVIVVQLPPDLQSRVD
jgi:hypothetical protein